MTYSHELNFLSTMIIYLPQEVVCSYQSGATRLWWLRLWRTIPHASPEKEKNNLMKWVITNECKAPFRITNAIWCTVLIKQQRFSQPTNFFPIHMNEKRKNRTWRYLKPSLRVKSPGWANMEWPLKIWLLNLKSVVF